jgi:hypothetical protein
MCRSVLHLLNSQPFADELNSGHHSRVTNTSVDRLLATVVTYACLISWRGFRLTLTFCRSLSCMLAKLGGAYNSRWLQLEVVMSTCVQYDA